MKRKCKSCANIEKIYKEFYLLNANLYKYNLYVFKKICETISQDRMNCNGNYCKSLRETDMKYLSVSEDKQDSFDILLANSHDIYSYHTQDNKANSEIQAIMKLDGRLDFDKLKRAVRLSVDAQPVFGCRFVEGEPPYWKRLDNIDEITFCSMEEIQNQDEAVQRFLQSPLDTETDPMVKVQVLRSEEYDILGVKVNEICCDGTGIKEYLELLANIYSCLDQVEGTFLPKPRIESREEQDSLLKELNRACPEVRGNPTTDTQTTKWTFPWRQRREASVSFEIIRLPQVSLELLYQYGRSREATVKDLILTAFYRTMFQISKPKYGVPMDILSTVNLRSYLPDSRTQAIRNLSGGIITRLSRRMNESFEDTLSRVVNATKEIKEIDEENVEKTSFTYFNDYFEHMSQVSENPARSSTCINQICYPGLCDLGDISEALIGFGSNVVTDAYITPSVVRAPGFLILVSTYNGTLTMSIGYTKDAISQKDVRGLLSMIKNELMRGCSNKK